MISMQLDGYMGVVVEARLAIMRQRIRNSAFIKSLNILPKADQNRIFWVTMIQIFLGLMDLLGVASVGLLGALSVSGIESSQPGERVKSVLHFLHIDTQTFQVQVGILGLTSVLFLVGRTMLSIFFTRRILFFLSLSGARISTNLTARLLSQPLTSIQTRTTQEIVFALTTGVTLITLQVLATSVVLVSDISLLIVMGLGLLFLDFVTALGTFIIFTVIGYFLYKFMHVRARDLGEKSSKLNVVSNEKIVEVFSSYREVVVSNRRDFYAREIGRIRNSLAETSAEINFLPYVSKYVIETAVIVGALLIGAAQFMMQDSSRAVATLAVFLAAGSRIAPAVLRIQQSTIQIRSGLGQANPTFDLIDSLKEAIFVESVDDSIDFEHQGFIPEIRLSNIGFTYPEKTAQAISDIQLNISAGTVLAVVGPSGAGKTSLIDILLGVLEPEEGSVLISGLPPLSSIAKWPGAIAYVPQDIVIVAGTIRENVALGYPPHEATEESVMNALRLAHLDKFIEELPLGIDTQVGERGAKFSGGQRQRLGIARALFTRPLLLVLDEATSSLDGQMEENISESIRQLPDSTTVVLIAHRLSTVRHADTVAYLEKGRILAVGTFDYVRKTVPDFDYQALLMGLELEN